MATAYIPSWFKNNIINLPSANLDSTYLLLSQFDGIEFIKFIGCWY